MCRFQLKDLFQQKVKRFEIMVFPRHSAVLKIPLFFFRALRRIQAAEKVRTL